MVLDILQKLLKKIKPIAVKGASKNNNGSINVPLH